MILLEEAKLAAEVKGAAQLAAERAEGLNTVTGISMQVQEYLPLFFYLFFKYLSMIFFAERFLFGASTRGSERTGFFLVFVWNFPHFFGVEGVSRFMI